LCFSLANQNSIKILHVDDDDAILEFVKEFVIQAEPNMIFTSLESPKDAIEFLRKQKFDRKTAIHKVVEINSL
jgi:two-component SAPR family response regulator